MKAGSLALIIGVGGGSPKAVITRWLTRFWAIESIWLLQSRQLAIHGYLWRSVTQIRTSWWCSCLDCRRSSPVSSRLAGETALLCWWMVLRTIVALKRGRVSIIWVFKWFWVHHTAMQRHQQSYGLLISRNVLSILRTSRQERGKWFGLMFWLDCR